MVYMAPRQSSQSWVSGLQCPEAIQSKEALHPVAVVADTRHVGPVCQLLTQDGYRVDMLHIDEVLSGSGVAQRYGMVLLDLNRFDQRSQSACSSLRTQNHDATIVVLSEDNAIEDRIRGFENGADEYIGKPFSHEEVSIRLRALVRRNRIWEETRSVLRFADLTIDLVARIAYRGERVIELSGREFALMVLFIQHPNQILSREFIYEEIWGRENCQESNLVDVYVNYLRNKTESGQNTRLIFTVRGQGYMLRDSGAN